MSDRRRDTADVKALLQARIESLVKELAPDGRRAGAYWIARNPTRDDRQAGSFWIKISGAPGAWRDEATGDKGDVIGLVQYITGLDFKGAMQWSRDWLGLARLDDATVRDARRQVETSREDDARRHAQLLEKNRRRAFAQWLAAAEDLEDTPVARYLRTRGIDLARLARPPGALRFAARRHLETGLTFPAMLALMTGPDPTGASEGVPYAVHCSFLADDGLGKAPVRPARKIWPSYVGATIRLTRGETGLTPREAAAHGLRDTLCLCEGVEDGLSLALAAPELRVWAAGTLGNLQHVTLPECCGEVIVAVDNDWGKPQAARQLEAGLDALARQGRPVRIARSHFGKDANDALLARLGEERASA
jgi:hypothetical protein